MEDIEHLELEIGSQMQSAGGILDNLDYNHLRRLGILLRNIPRTHDDWDLPPASLQGWIASYAATIEAVQMAERSGLFLLLKEKSEIIRNVLSPSMIPSVDLQIVGEKNAYEMISYAKKHDRFKDFDFERFYSTAPTKEEIARAIVVELDRSILFMERPEVDKQVGLKRLQIGALVGKAASGGAFAVANLSLGAAAGLSLLPAIIGNVSAVLGIIGSAYTGFAAAFDAIEKISVVLRK